MLLKETLHWPIVTKIPVSRSSYKEETDRVLHSWHLGGRSISESGEWQGDKVHGCESKGEGHLTKNNLFIPMQTSTCTPKARLLYPMAWVQVRLFCLSSSYNIGEVFMALQVFRHIMENYVVSHMWNIHFSQKLTQNGLWFSMQVKTSIYLVITLEERYVLSPNK